MFSIPVTVKNKNAMIDMFETLSHFPKQVMVLKNGDNTVDAHSLMGFLTIDESKPMELVFENEPNEELKQAMSKFTQSA
ncbi:MAG: hypothetical protein LUF33_05460 [Clostridiales bacterium]|nr:hypothetical protein [Clostridiales bacterium]